MADLIPRFSRAIAVLFVLSGAVSLYSSVNTNLEMLALIGLGFMFWGAIFFLISPSGFVDARLLVSTVYSEYSTFDRITYDFNCKKSVYAPCNLAKLLLPAESKPIKDPLLFVSVEPHFKVSGASPQRFLLANDEGIVLTPPGLGIMKLIEKKKGPISKMSTEKLCEVTSHTIAEELALAKDVAISVKNQNIHLTLKDSIYFRLYDAEKGSTSSRIIGCPIASAVACIFAQSTEKMIRIDSVKTSEDSTVDVYLTVGN